MDTDPGVERWSWLLRDHLRQQRRSLRSIERQLGWSNGYLSLVLRDGPPALKVEQVLAVLRAIGVPPRVYFAELYGLPLAPGDPTPPTRDEMEKLMDERIREEQSRRERDTRALRDDVDRLLARLAGDPGPIDRERLRAVVTETLRDDVRRLASPDETRAAGAEPVRTAIDDETKDTGSEP